MKKPKPESLGHPRGRVHKTAIAVALATLVAGASVAVAAGTRALIKMKVPADAEATPVVFKHWKHQRDFKCYSCHPGLFSKYEKAVFDHDDMDAGRYCGACHNGKLAFVPEDVDCEVCHVE